MDELRSERKSNTTFHIQNTCAKEIHALTSLMELAMEMFDWREVGSTAVLRYCCVYPQTTLFDIMYLI